MTKREFDIKHDAFMREQERRLYTAAWQVMKLGRFKTKPTAPEQILGYVPRRYPEKPWLK